MLRFSVAESIWDSGQPEAGRSCKVISKKYENLCLLRMLYKYIL